MTDKKDKALINLSGKHLKLVDGLKKALFLSQVGFLQAGKFLYKIYSKKTFLAEDSSREITFTEFCQRPDLPFQGRTEEARLRMAQRLIRIYKFFVIDKGYSEDKLVPIGMSKLDMLVPVMKSQEKKADEWLKKAGLLTSFDLASEIHQKDKSLSDVLNCSHKNIKEVVFYKCLDCGNCMKHNPQDKHTLDQDD